MCRACLSLHRPPRLLLLFVVAFSPPPPPATSVQEIFASPTAEVSALAASISLVEAPSSTTTAPLLSASVATTSALAMPPPHSSAPSVPPSFVLASTSPFTSSHPNVSLDHIYFSRDVDSLCGVGYKPEQKTLAGFVSTFDKNLIRLARVHNATNSLKVFLQQSL